MQYVFMFLTKLEAEKYVEYTNLILYGLDVLLGQDTGKQGSANGSIFVLSAEQVRLANLTFDTLFKVKRKHEFGNGEVLFLLTGGVLFRGTCSNWRSTGDISLERKKGKKGVHFFPLYTYIYIYIFYPKTSVQIEKLRFFFYFSPPTSPVYL